MRTNSYFMQFTLTGMEDPDHDDRLFTTGVSVTQIPDDIRAYQLILERIYQQAIMQVREQYQIDIQVENIVFVMLVQIDSFKSGIIPIDPNMKIHKTL